MQYEVAEEGSARGGGRPLHSMHQTFAGPDQRPLTPWLF